MRTKCLTYTSLASLDLSDQDLSAILQTARQMNALNAITGLLIFNGTHFLQVIEGPETSIEELMDRLRQDDRHHHVEVREEYYADERSFPDWTMELVRVQSSYFEAKSAVTLALPKALPSAISDRILRMTEQISGTIDLRG
jgi:hypothetical protein